MTTNLGLVTNGLNAWIAEVGDVGVGIEENNWQSNYIVYPNPVKSEKSQIINKVILSDINGKIIQQTNLISNKK